MDVVCPCSFIIKEPFKPRDTTKWFPFARIPFLAYRHVKRKLLNLSEVRNLVFLPVSLLREFQVASGSWVLVWKRSEKGLEPLQYAKVLATELVFNETSSEYTSSDSVKQLAWLSPSLFFQSQGADMVSIENLQRIKPSEATETFPFLLRGVKVPTASEVAVARVKNAKPLQDWEDPFVSFCLKKFFQMRRILRLGEVFSIFITHEWLMDWCQYSYEVQKVPLLNKIDFDQYFSIDMGRKIFFFRVEKLLSVNYVISEEEPTIIDPEVTKVSQLPGVCSTVPVDVYLFELQEYHLMENVELLSKHSSCLTPELFNSLKYNLENHLAKEPSRNMDWKAWSFSILLYGSDNVDKHSPVQDVCYSLGLPLFDIDCLRIFSSVDDNSLAQMEQFLSLLQERYFEFQPCALLLRNIEVLDNGFASNNINSTRVSCKARLLSKLEELLNSNGSTLKESNIECFCIVFATCQRVDDLDPQVRTLFLDEVEVPILSEDVRKRYLQVLLRKVLKFGRNSIDFANKYGSILRSFSDKMLYFWCSQVMLNYLKEVGVEKNLLNLSEKAMSNVTRNMEDRANMAVVKSSLRVPKVTWKDVGGLSNVRELVIESIQLPLLHPEWYENSSGARRRSGLLFYGPPGTGKTLLAKAIANECGCSFLSVKGPELMNMYVGESEKNVRDIFSKAREAAPCVVFFDELDSLAPMRGQSSDGGGVMDRVLSQLLTEMDDLHSIDKTRQKGSSSLGVIVVGATNRPDLLDSALLRPGRFDKLIYIGSPETREARFEVLCALTRKFVMSEDVDLMTIATCCPKVVSGADLYGLCADAWLFAAKRTIRMYELGLEQQSSSSSEKLEVTVCQQDFLDANTRLVPSLSEEMLHHYKQLVKRFSSTEL